MSEIDSFTRLNMKQRLKERGVSLRDGLSEKALSHLIGSFKFKLDANIIAMYREFDGLVEGEIDSGSAFNIWSIERVLNENRSAIALGKSRLSFADFLMDSNELTCDFSSANSPVHYLDDPQSVAESFLEFCSKLVDGEYDF